MTRKEKMPFKSGFATLVGRSNVGKSTLLNTLAGTKIAAVTEKPQTTRDILRGIVSDERGQIVFVDTPGILKHKKSALAGKMIKRAREAMQDINVLIYVVDPSKQIGEEDRYVLSVIRKLADIPKLLVINKDDLPKEQKKYLEDYLDLADEFDGVFEVSALKDRHIKNLKNKVFELMPPGDPFYPIGQITDIDNKKWIAEIIREKIFNILRQEVPYSTHVEVENLEDREGIIMIEAIIYTNDSRYKKMIIGRNGQTIKQIGVKARQELELALNKKIFLDLEVETDRRWEERV